MSNWFPKWQPYQGKIDHRPVATNEYLPPLQSAVLGVQHAFAMFGATVLAPLLMGFSPNLAILMSGICTIIFFLITGGRVPSYLGSSFAFIGVRSQSKPCSCAWWNCCLWYFLCLDRFCGHAHRHALD